MEQEIETEVSLSDSSEAVSGPRHSRTPLDASTPASHLQRASDDDSAPAPKPQAPDEGPVPGFIEAEPLDGAEPPEAIETPDAASNEAHFSDAALAELRNQLAQLTEETAKYHTRAQQRESVIDSMHAELEQLRRGERRSLLRPLITEVCRLRDDLLRQAETLPQSFDRKAAVELLLSYADSLDLALQDNGVTSFAPEVGEAFQARLHRVANKVPTREKSLVGSIASVASPGYRDLEAGATIAAARVVVYVLRQSEPESLPTAAESTEAPGDSSTPTPEQHAGGASNVSAPQDEAASESSLAGGRAAASVGVPAADGTPPPLDPDTEDVVHEDWWPS